MPHCQECGKSLSTSVGLRRHANSQHKRSVWHACKCGKQYLDPAGRSRCRRSHLNTFCCPVWGCLYQSGRKDTVKQHVRSRHPDSVTLEVLTLPALGTSSPESSTASFGSNTTPPPELVLPSPSIFQPQSDATHASPSQSDDPPYPGLSPGESWSPYD